MRCKQNRHAPLLDYHVHLINLFSVQGRVLLSWLLFVIICYYLLLLVIICYYLDYHVYLINLFSVQERVFFFWLLFVDFIQVQKLT